MLDAQDKLKETKGKAQAKFDEVARLVVDGDNSLTQLLVKAFRHGHEPDKAREAFTALKRCIDDAAATYEAAIAQPEAKVTTKSRVVL